MIVDVSQAWSTDEHEHADGYITASREFREVVIADDLPGIEPHGAPPVASKEGRP